MAHYPKREEAPTSLLLPWPNAQEPCQFTTKLEWLDLDSTRPDWAIGLPLQTDRDQPQPGLPEALKDGGDTEHTYLPVWTCRSGEENWWVVDAHSGKVLAGEVSANRDVAFWRLMFCAFLAIFVAFFGGGLAQMLLLQILGIASLGHPGHGAGLPGVGLGVLLILGLLWRLGGLLPAALEEPAKRLQTGRIALPSDDRWLGLLKALGILATVSAMSLSLSYLSLGAFGSGIGVILVGCCQIGFTCLLAYHCFRFSSGHQLSSAPARLEGMIGSKVSLGIRVTLFALGGQMLGGVWAMSGMAGDSLQASLASLAMLESQGARFGALLAVVTARLSNRSRTVLLTGTGANLVGAFLLGPLYKASLTLVAVAIPGLIQSLRCSGSERGAKVREALKETWSFNLGAVCGRLLGRAFGLFFLGLGGSAVGQALGEQIMSCLATSTSKVEDSPNRG